MKQSNETYLTVTEVADLTRTSPGTVRNWLERGLLPYFRLGRTIRVDRASVMKALSLQAGAEQPEEGEPAQVT